MDVARGIVAFHHRDSRLVMLLVLAETFIARDVPQNGELILLLLLLLLLLGHLPVQVQIKFTRCEWDSDGQMRNRIIVHRRDTGTNLDRFYVHRLPETGRNSFPYFVQRNK